MPKHLLARCAPDSIREFTAAARQRDRDARAAAETGRTTAAVYLAGYAAEMLLKAAYFRLIGMGDSDPLTISDLARAKADGKRLGLTWEKTTTI